MSTWREKAAPIVAQVIREHAGATEGELRVALRDAYPFGQRAYWPYRVWCDEVRRQLGKSASLAGARRRRQMVKSGQMELFG